MRTEASTQMVSDVGTLPELRPPPPGREPVAQDGPHLPRGLRRLCSLPHREGDADRCERHRREHVEAWIEELLERWKPATASNRYRGLQAFMRWAGEDGEIRESPMAKMPSPEDSGGASRRPVGGGDAGAARGLLGPGLRGSARHRVAHDADRHGRSGERGRGLRYTPTDPETNDVDLDQAFASGDGQREPRARTGHRPGHREGLGQVRARASPPP